MSVGTQADRAANSETMDRVARFGLAARAGIYLIIGVLALVLAFGRKGSSGKRGTETDQRGAVQELSQHSGGVVLILLLAVGLSGYALWRFAEAVVGVTGDGDGAGARAQSAIRGAVYAFLAVSAFTILVQGRDSSQANQQQSFTARVMQHTFGRWLVGLVGIVVVVIGAVLIYEGVTRKFEKYFDLARMSHAARRATDLLGTAGTVARGLVFAVSGVLVVVAAVQFDPSKARGIDGALRALRDLPLGPWLLGLTAVGLVMFGLFGLCEARWRRT